MGCGWWGVGLGGALGGLLPIEDPNLSEEPRYQAKLAALRAAIDEGNASGIAEGDVFARVREALNLPVSTCPRRKRSVA